MADETSREKSPLLNRGTDWPARTEAADDDSKLPGLSGIVKSPPPELPGYRNLTEIHTTGMNVVYRATSEKLGRVVAIDMLTKVNRRDAAVAARFRAEAATLARLRHPNLSQILEFGEHDGSPYLVLEYTEGGSLALYAKAVRLSKQEIAMLIEPIARAVQVMHDHGIIHRDLRPSNVLVAADGVPRIADFGLAVRLAGETPVAPDGKILGNIAYMAPEQAHPKLALSTAADVYSLGAILFEILAGRPPMVGGAPMDTAMKAKALEVVSPRELDPTVPRDLEAICMKCLRRDPRDRYPSAGAFADDLKRFVSGEPIEARSISSIERTLKWGKRRPLIAILALLLVSLIVADVAGLWVLYRRAVDGERRAMEGERRAREAYERLLEEQRK